MSHTWRSRVTHMDSRVTHMEELCDIYNGVMLYIWRSCVTHAVRYSSQDLIHTYEWVMYHAHTNEPCHTNETVMSLICICHVTHMNNPCHTWISHVTLVTESCRTYEWVMSRRWHGPRTRAWRCCFVCVMSRIWRSHVTHMQESCLTHESVIFYTWMGHVTHMKESCHTYEGVMSHICRSHVTHVNESCNTCDTAKKWRHGCAAG